MHRYLLHNGSIRETSELCLSPGQVGFMNGWGVFSTLLVTEGVLFAFERHYARMKRDAERLRVPFTISDTSLHDALLRLVLANDATDATLRVAIVRNKGGLFEGPRCDSESDLIAFTAPNMQWGNGVRLTYVPHGRHAASAFAGAKYTSWAENLTWNEMAHDKGFDEVVLLNEHGEVSECTSANIFIINGKSVVTPPVHSSGCLPGITRALLLNEIAVDGVSLVEANLTPAQLEAADQVFITSTTRDLLPVIEIDGCPLSQKRQTFDRLKASFLQFRRNYVRTHAPQHAAWLK